MSFGPIYAKIREIDERINKIEASPISQPVMSSILSSDIDSSSLNNLLNECSINSSSIAQLSTELTKYTTKDELAPLATKDELATLATKDELAPLATKDELADLLVKFDNIINIVGQLNTRIDELTAKITA